MEAKELVQKAQDKKYTEFDSQTKSILAQRVAQQLKDKGYFDRLDVAKGINEAGTLVKFKNKEGLEDAKKILDEKGASYEVAGLSIALDNASDTKLLKKA